MPWVATDIDLARPAQDSLDPQPHMFLSMEPLKGQRAKPQGKRSQQGPPIA